MKENKIVTFDSSKQMRFIRELGKGGTGSTWLFLDESVDMYFAIKKYDPLKESDREEYYKRFVDEIKILFRLAHNNIVRIYNYYLYPNSKVGYIQMEFIDGNTIDKVNPLNFKKSWNDYFIETINAFDYLYENNIIHRDIRPNNFMIDNNGTLKIIDFGFGKNIDKSSNQNSIILNWPATNHAEEVILKKDYTFSTEIYYLGILFKHLVKNDNTFLYSKILEKMTEYSPENRYENYKEIKRDISNDLITQISFKPNEKEQYLRFADDLYNSITKFTSSPVFIYDYDKIRISLEKVVKVAALENYIQKNNDVISCFVNADFRYRTKQTITSEHIIDFYKLLVNTEESKKQIVIDSIIARLQSIPVEYKDKLNDTDLPF